MATPKLSNAQRSANTAAADDYAAKLRAAADGRDTETINPADVEVMHATQALERLSERGIAAGDMKVRLTEQLGQALAAELASGRYEMTPTFVKLEPGDMIRGTLVDTGTVEIEDKRTKQLKPVATWTLEDENGFRARFLSAHQLDQELNEETTNEQTGEVVKRPKLGRYVILCRLPDERIPNGNMVGRWRIAILRERPTDATSGVTKGAAK